MCWTKTLAGKEPEKPFQNAPTGSHVATIIRRISDVNGATLLTRNSVWRRSRGVLVQSVNPQIGEEKEL